MCRDDSSQGAGWGTTRAPFRCPGKTAPKLPKTEGLLQRPRYTQAIGFLIYETKKKAFPDPEILELWGLGGPGGPGNPRNMATKLLYNRLPGLILG